MSKGKKDLAVGDKVVLTKKHIKKYYGDLDFIFEGRTIGGSMDLEGFKDAITCFIATKGVGIVTKFNSSRDPYVVFRHVFEGRVYKYAAYFELKGVQEL